MNLKKNDKIVYKSAIRSKEMTAYHEQEFPRLVDGSVHTVEKAGKWVVTTEGDIIFYDEIERVIHE